MKKVKNNTQENKTWNGQVVEPGEYYTIQYHEEGQWANNVQLLTDIANVEAVINDGTSDISNVNDSINWLKDHVAVDTDGTPLIRSMPLANTDNLLFKGTGVKGTATKATDANTPIETNIDYKMPERRLINGVKIILKNHMFGDSAKFQVVDKDNVLGYGAGVVLNEFGTDWYFGDDAQDQDIIILPYPANIPADVYIRLKYKASGTASDVSVCMNLFLHKKQS